MIAMYDRADDTLCHPKQKLLVNFLKALRRKSVGIAFI